MGKTTWTKKRPAYQQEGILCVSIYLQENKIKDTATIKEQMAGKK